MLATTTKDLLIHTYLNLIPSDMIQLARGQLGWHDARRKATMPSYTWINQPASQPTLTWDPVSRSQTMALLLVKL